MNKWIDDYKKEVRNATDRMEMRSDVRRTPINGNNVKDKKKPFALPKWSAAIGAVAACIVIVAIVLAVVLPGGNVVTPPNGGQSSGSATTPSGANPSVTTVFRACVVETNPSVMFVVDDNLVVTDVKRLNSDAEMLFSDSLLSSAIGSSLDDTLSDYAELLAKTGFIDIDSKNNAIRISGYGIEDKISSVKDKVRDTLSSKGIFSVVLAEEVDLTTLKDIVGLTSSEENIESAIESMKSGYEERITESSSTLEELISGYEQRAYEEVLTSIRLNADRLISQGLILSELNRLNATIMISSGNPGLFKWRYWDVKDKDLDPTSDCANVVKQMENELKEFEEKFGYAIESQAQLNELTDAYSELKYEALIEALNNLSLEFVRANREILSRLMKFAGCDTTAFDALLDLPETLDDYLEKTALSYKKELDSRLDTYKDAFGAEREALTSSDYDRYVSDIVEKYGSLEAYWSAIKNN